jgi:hypothetical protein
MIQYRAYALAITKKLLANFIDGIDVRLSTIFGSRNGEVEHFVGHVFRALVALISLTEIA